MDDQINPFIYQGVPTCNGSDCPQFTRRLRKDGEPSQTRPWFCALDGERHYHVCPPAVRRMSEELVQLRKLVQRERLDR